MGRFTRREILLSAAAASIAFGLDRHLAISAPVTEQRSPDPQPGFYRFIVGDAECIVIYDGIWEKPHDPSFVKNASVADVKQALIVAGLKADFIPIPVAALVVKTKHKLVLCDAGGGGQVHPLNPNSVLVSGKLIPNLWAAGIDPQKIQTILVSHFHPNHILGLVEPLTNRPVFPNAEIIVPGVEYRWWINALEVGGLSAEWRRVGERIQGSLAKWKNVLRVEGEDEVVPGIRFVGAPGHTPGHTALHLSSGNAQLLISADLICVPALFAAHPSWQGSYDQDGQKAVETRRRLLDRVITDNMMISGTHFPWPGVGKITKDGAGYAFVL